MKKAVVFALTGIMAVSMFGCGSKKQVEVSSVAVSYTHLTLPTTMFV